MIRDLYPDYRLADLLTDIEQVKGLEDVRLSSIEPQLFTPDVLAVFRTSKQITHHFHIPIQSGSDAILKVMKRHLIGIRKQHIRVMA